MKQLFIVLMVALSLPAMLMAQGSKETKYKANVWGFLVDDMTGAPVVGAKVTILSAKDSTVIDTLTTVEGNSGYIKRTFVIFTITEPGEYIIKAEADGYEPTVNRWRIEKLYKHEGFIQVTAPWYIRRPKKKRDKDIHLGEAVVKASRVKFYYKGDTIVYNADAFELAEGSMLDALIKQLPGVELKEGGEITVNGRRVDELLINGKDFLNNDRASLLENLPTYMVKNIKVFEKNDAMRELMGDTINKNLAMDVRLKKEYSTSFVGNVDAGLGTNHTALARAFGLRIAPNSAFKIHGNANNVNETHDPGEQGDWTPLQQAMSVYNIYRTGANYHYANDKIYYANMVHARYTENKNDSYSNSESFLSTGNTFWRSFNRGKYYSSAFATNHTFYTKKKIPLGPIEVTRFLVNPSLDYSDDKGHSHSGSASANSDIYGSYGKEWRDSITTPNAGQLLRTYGLNRTKNDNKRHGYGMSATSNYNIFLRPAHDTRFSFQIFGKTNFTNTVNRLYEHYNLEYMQTANSDFRNRHTYTKSQGLEHSIGFSTGNISFLKRFFSFDLSYNYIDKKQVQTRSLYLLNKLDAWGEETGHPLGELPSVDEMLQTLDSGNSYWQREDNYINRIYPRLQFNSYNNKKVKPKVGFAGSFTPLLTFRRDRLRYQRAALDTLVTRNQNTVAIDASLWIFPGGKNWPFPWDVFLKYKTSVTLPSMDYFVDYRDDSNPLNIMTGNPNLRNTLTHNMSIELRRNMKKQRMLNSSINAHIYERRIAMGYTYDTQTGVRTIMPSNINGNWDITGRLNYSARFDKDGKFTYSANTEAIYINSVDMIEQLRSEVHTTNFNETLKFNMRLSAKASVNFKGDLHWQHSTSGREDFTTINVADFDYGLGGVFQIPFDFKFSTDITMYSRRGYNDHSMNTNDLVWNVRLSRSFAKSGLTVMLDAFDLFGQLSNVRRTINAQGRTETWSNVTPQYAMLHVLYRLNKKNKETK